jgi:hypothetical protein
MKVNLTPILSVVLLNIHFLVHSAEIIFNESRLRTNENDIPLSSHQFSPSDKYIGTTRTESLVLKDPPKISHTSISLQSISPNLFMQLVAGTNTPGYSGDNGPATSAQIHAMMPYVDVSGNIYTPCHNRHVIRKVDSTVVGVLASFLVITVLQPWLV